mgnify:CR=1 FL=1
MIRLLLAATLLLVTPPLTPPQTADPPAPIVELRVRHLTPTHVAYRITIIPHRDNFWFCMGWDNTTTYASRTSCQQLNGIYSPRVFYQEYTLMEGCYQGFVDVYRTPNYRAGAATYQFRIGDHSCA